MCIKEETHTVVPVIWSRPALAAAHTASNDFKITEFLTSKGFHEQLRRWICKQVTKTQTD